MIRYKSLTDEQLVPLSLKDEKSFYCLMKRYEAKILRYIKQIANINQEESEDILQEILIKVYKNLNGFNPKLSFSSWIYRIAHNEVINNYRKNKSHSKTISLDMGNDDNGLTELIYDTFDIHEKYISKEKTETIRTALAELPDKYREILILRYFEDQSYKEISDILRKPQGTIATLVNRAKSKFKKLAVKYELSG
ncbi:MAG: RNA polymerase sigma factor [Deltaproteobacteria bacterium]|nr:RNA polymerase sigma factor [Deltaproteobacteria bacterium]